MKVPIIFILINLSVFQIFGQKAIEGTYKSKNYPETNKIVFKNDRSFCIIQKYPGVYQYTDTLSFGKYNLINKNIIELNSYYQEVPNIQSSFIKMNVEEQVDRNPDSLYFIIKNDFEDKYCMNMSFDERPIFYKISLSGVNEDSSRYKFKLLPNYIQISRSDLDYFSIAIIPSSLTFYGHLSLNYIYSDIYNLNNQKSNVFLIDFPELDVNYICMKRLYSEYLIIKDNTTLIWQGEEYTKIPLQW